MKQQGKKLNKLNDIFKRFKIENIHLSTEAAGIDVSYTNWDREAAWIMYVELLTRVTTQELSDDEGVELTALESIYSFFQTTRDVLKDYGRNAKNFTEIAIIVLNQVIRPFTTKWHSLSRKNAFGNVEKCKEFREELSKLRINLVNYASLLADMAKVCDFTKL